MKAISVDVMNDSNTYDEVFEELRLSNVSAKDKVILTVLVNSPTPSQISYNGSKFQCDKEFYWDKVNREHYESLFRDIDWKKLDKYDRYPVNYDKSLHAKVDKL